MSKIGARELSFRLVFGSLFNNTSDSKDIIQDGIEQKLIVPEEQNIVEKLYMIVQDNLQDIKNKLSSNLKNNIVFKDIYPIDSAILLCGIAEIDYLDADKGLVINECVKLAKKYSTAKSPSFINGVLSSIYK